MPGVQQQNGAPTRRFDDAWSVADRVPGWLTRAQGRALWEAATSIDEGGLVVEIGSHQGRSTVVLGTAAAVRGGSVVAIDPFVDGAMFGGGRTRTSFVETITRAGLDDVVRLVPERSHDVLAGWRERVAVLYVDGKHDYWSCTRDLGWVTHLRPGGRVLVHDAFSSVGVTLSLLREQVRWRPRVRYVGREGSLAELTVGVPSRSERRAVLGELPWFSRNLVVKVARRLRLRPVLRLLRHESPYDPY